MRPMPDHGRRCRRQVLSGVVDDEEKWPIMAGVVEDEAKWWIVTGVAYDEANGGSWTESTRMRPVADLGWRGRQRGQMVDRGRRV